MLDLAIYIQELSDSGMPVTARDWPYNRHVNVPRVSSFGEYVADIFQRLAEWEA